MACRANIKPEDFAQTFIMLLKGEYYAPNLASRPDQLLPLYWWQKNGISHFAVTKQLLAGLANDIFEIRVRQTEDLYRLFLKSPEEALQLNPAKA